MNRLRFFPLVLAALLSAASARADGVKPQRIVSVNMCLDELVLRLAEPQHVASVTWLSRDPLNSNVADIARTVPINHGAAEEALLAHPDLVLVGPFTPAPTRAMLTHVGAPVVEYGVPETLADVRAQVRDVAKTLGEPAHGEALVADLDRRLDAASLDPRLPKLKAIILRPMGFTVGPGSLVDELLARAGIENIAERLGIGSYQQVPLERVATLDADVLIVNSEGVGAPSLATEALHHPLIAALAKNLQVVAVPSKLWTCAGPGVADAVEALVAGTAELRKRKAALAALGPP